MNGDMEKIMAAYEAAEADEGFSGFDVLPAGRYPVKVHVQETGTSNEKGTPYARLDLQVLEGPYKGRHAFVTVWLLDVFAAAEYLADRESKEWRNLQRCKGLLTALGFDAPDPVAATQGTYASTGEASLAYWRVNEWEGRNVLASVGVETAEKQMQQAQERGVALTNPRDRNRLSGWKVLNEETLAGWREKDLPKQQQQQAGAASKPASQPGELRF